MNIKICDAIMGAGKTSAAINYMNESDGKFIFITPYLNECDRIIDSCQIKDFKSPKDKPRSKLLNLHFLLEKKFNISSTHALFSSYTEETIRLIREGHYTLVMDEVFEIVKEVSISKGDVQDLINSGYIEVDKETCRVRWLKDSYVGTSFQDLMLRAKAGTLLYYNDTFLFWMFPPEVFQAFDEVIVLTYLFDAQLQKYYFDINGLKYRYIGVEKTENGDYIFSERKNQFRKIPGLRDKVHILDNDKLNSIGDEKFALSSSWSDRQFNNAKSASRMRNNIYNVFRHYFSGKGKDCMWTSFKAQKDKISPPNYTRCFIPCSCRATNEYRDRRNLAYCVNIFFNPFLKRYFEERGCTVNEDRYALSEMIQWIWRSAIRSGEEINIYVPSQRMRNLLIEWLDEVGSTKNEHIGGDIDAV